MQTSFWWGQCIKISNFDLSQYTSTFYVKSQYPTTSKQPSTGPCFLQVNCRVQKILKISKNLLFGLALAIHIYPVRCLYKTLYFDHFL